MEITFERSSTNGRPGFRSLVSTGLVLFTIDHHPGCALNSIYQDAASLVIAVDDGKMFASVNDHARLPSRNHL